MTVNDIYNRLPAAPKTLSIPTLGGRGAALTLSRKGASGVNVGFGGKGNSFDLQARELAVVEARYDALRATGSHLKTGLYGNPRWAARPAWANYIRTPFIAAVVHYFRGIPAAKKGIPKAVLEETDCLEDFDEAKRRNEAEIVRRRAMQTKAQTLQPSAARTPPPCDANCETPCNIAIWERFGHSFWIRVWGRKFTPSAIPTLWDSWINEAVNAASWRFKEATQSGRITLPVRKAMADHLYEFFIRDWHLHRGTSPTAFLAGGWRELLEQLNKDAAVIVGIIWGTNGGVVYGRSQKVASLVGKYLMVHALLRKDLLAFKEFARLLPVVVDKEGTLDHLRKVAGFRGFTGSWVKKLNWNDYLTIQKAAKDLADSRCCESPAIYELCHMW